MAQDAIHLLFDVEGGDSLSGATGKEIIDQLSGIVSKINNGSSKIPKIQLDVGIKDGALETIKKELEAISKGTDVGKVTSAFSSMESTFNKIADNTGVLKKELTGLKSAIESITKSLPQSGSALAKMGESGSQGIDTLVERLQTVKEIIEQISAKDFSVTNVFSMNSKGNKSNELGLYKTQLQELVSVIDDYKRAMGAMSKSADFQKDVSTVLGGRGNYAKLLMEMQVEFAKAEKVIGSEKSGLNEFKNSADKLIPILSTLQGVFSKLGATSPDTSGIEKAMSDIEAYEKRVKDLEQRFKDAADAATGVGGTQSSAGGESSSLSQTGSNIAGSDNIEKTCEEIGNSFDELRKKIESTFDLGTVNTNSDKIKSEIEEIASKLPEIKTTVAEIKKVNNQNNSTEESSTEKEIKSFQELKTTMNGYYKELTELRKASQRNSDVEFKNGVFELPEDKDERVKTDERLAELDRANERLKKYRELLSDKYKIQIDNDGLVETKNAFENAEASAKEAGISVQQYRSLIISATKSNNDFEGSVDKSANSARKSWDGIRQKAENTLQSLKSKGADKNDFGVASLMKELEEAIKTGTPESIDEVTKKIDLLDKKVIETGADTETWGHKMAKTFGGHLRTALASVIVAKVTQYLKQVYDNVVKLDSAVVNLQIATGKNRDETKKLVKEYSALAKTLGATTAEVAESADTWLRQGYSIEETNKLIEASMILSKLGQIESAEASKALTSAMRGYKLEATDVMNITDKLTAVDMEAAVTAGGIATAMAETATSAKLAGVEMDTLIGYITTVTEVTQDSEEAVGTFYKTLFARMNNVAAGKFVDEETGESLNDVETVLAKLGISLRDTNGLFRNTSTVLDEVAGRWQSFDNVQQHAIATAIAGTRQQEKFITLMENYSSAMDYTAISANSAGNAQEKYVAFTEGIEAAFNRLTASWEEFSQNILNSDVVIMLIDMLTGLVEVLGNFVSAGDGAALKIVAIISAVTALTTILSTMGKSVGIIRYFNIALATTGKVSGALIGTLRHLGKALLNILKSPTTYITIFISLWMLFKDKISAGGKVIVAVIAGIALAVGIALASMNKAVYAFMSSNPIGWILLALTALVIGIQAVIGAINDAANAEQKQREEALASAEALQKEADALNEVADAARKTQEEIKSLADEFRELENATKSDWYDTLVSLGDKATGLFDENLTPFEAILKLLGDTYTYEQLINAAEKDRLTILTEIEKATAGVSSDKQKAAYDAQKEATTAKLNALAMTSRVSKGDEGWGDRSRGSKKNAIDSASNILAGTGINIERDGASANITFDIERDDKGAIVNHEAYIKQLEDAIAKFQQSYAYDLTELEDNAIYQFLETSLSDAKESMDAEMNAARDVLNSATMQAGSATQRDLTNKDLHSEYERIKKEIKASLQNNNVINELFNEEDLERSAVDYIRKYYEELYNAANNVSSPVIIEFESLNDAFDKTDGKFDVLKTAMEEMSESGRLTADTIAKISGEFPELLKYLDLSEEGFGKLDYSMGKMFDDLKLAAIENVDKAREEYEAALAEYENSDVKTKEDYDLVISKRNTLEEAKNSAQYLQMMETARTRELLEERFADSLEKQTDALEEQKDAFSELCDIRKDLINSYKEELDYQNKLQKQQRKVSSLNTQLAVAKLDTSAAGQARVRELEAELEEAEAELEDMTLEHAIDTLVEEIENENKQYEDFIDEEIKTLQKKLEDISKMSTEELVTAIKSSGGKTDDVTGSEEVDSDFDVAIDNGNNSISGTSVSDFNTSTEVIKGEAQKYITDNQMMNKDRANWMSDKGFSDIVSKYEQAGGNGKELVDSLIGYTPAWTNSGMLESDGSSSGYKLSGLDGDWARDDVQLTIGGVEFDLRAGNHVTEENNGKAIIDALYGITGSGDQKGKVVVYQGVLYVNTKEGWRKMWSDKDDVSSAAQAYVKLLNSYHTGGFVGGLESNEEFAKLLKGEFVTTPAQMQRFMNHTLPNIVNSSHGGHEFNAPLISIQCDNVTTESMPKLEQIVDKAVKEIQDCLDKGMNRMGHRTSKQKLLF